MSRIRAATAEDAPQLVELIGLLEHAVDEAGVRQRIAALAFAGIPQLVASDGEHVLGLCGLHLMTAIHRPQPVGRITILVVREEARGLGLGRQLLLAAEELLRARGCGLVEVTSNERLTDAHGFYARMGYQRTSYRFAKMLQT
jgi:GNAT superfamily N-acetyltransferase